MKTKAEWLQWFDDVCFLSMDEDQFFDWVATKLHELEREIERLRAAMEIETVSLKEIVWMQKEIRRLLGSHCEACDAGEAWYDGPKTCEGVK